MRRLLACAAALFVTSAFASSALADSPTPAAAPSSAPSAAPADESAWCAPELTTLKNDVCSFTPADVPSGPRTLVIFLHGVTEPGSNWQWTFQRAAMRIATSKGFSVITPRGRRGIGPKGMEDWWTWPTAETAQQKVESDLLAEWTEAKEELEAKSGAKFERVWIFGFSNGAYYATSLAMRGRLADDGDAKHPIADGYAAFAGGSGASYLKLAAAKTKTRPRFFVGWGGKDPKHGDQEELAAMLHDLGWPSKSDPAKNAGHTATDRQLSDAVAFLSGKEIEPTPEPAATPSKMTARAHSKKATTKKKGSKKPKPKKS